jgi:hypothetical protein
MPQNGLMLEKYDGCSTMMMPNISYHFNTVTCCDRWCSSSSCFCNFDFLLVAKWLIENEKYKVEYNLVLQDILVKY